MDVSRLKKISAFFNKRETVLLTLFLFSFLIRFFLISKGPFHYDALDLAVCVEKTLQTLRLHYQYGTGYPLTVILGSMVFAFLRALGITDPVFAVNVTSVIAGALGVVLLYLVAEKLLDSSTALFSAFLFSTFAPHVAISTFGKNLTLSICLALTGAYFMIRFLQEHRRIFFILSSVFLGFLGATRLPDIFVAIPLMGSYLLVSRDGVLRKAARVCLFIVIAAAVTGFFYLPMLMDKNMDMASLVASLLEHRPIKAKFYGLFSPLFFLSFSWLLSVFTIPGVLSALAGFAAMFFERSFAAVLFLFLWLIPLHFYYGNFIASHVRYFCLVWIPIILAQGYFLGRFKKGVGVSMAIFAAVFLSPWNLARHIPVLEFRHKRALQVEFVKWVEKMTPRNSAVIAGDEALFFKFYTSCFVLQRPNAEEAEDIAGIRNFFDRNVALWLASGRDVYLIESAVIAYDRKGYFKKNLFERYDLLKVGDRRNEVWHHTLLDQDIWKEGLYKLLPKSFKKQADLDE